MLLNGSQVNGVVLNGTMSLLPPPDAQDAAAALDAFGAAAWANKQPLRQIELNVGPQGRPAELTLITPEVPHQDAQVDQTTGEVITPEVPYAPPVYGEPVLVPAMPSFQELIGQNLEVYGALRDAVCQFALGQPAFSGGTLI